MSQAVLYRTGLDVFVPPGTAKSRTWRRCQTYLVDRYIRPLILQSSLSTIRLNTSPDFCFFYFIFFSLFHLKIFYRVLREISAGEELTVWYANALAQWYDISTTATPTHDEKGK